MLSRLRNSDGQPSNAMRLLAALLILAVGAAVLATAVALALPALRWAFPALF